MLRQLRSHTLFRLVGHMAVAIVFLTFVGFYSGARNVLFLALPIALITFLNIWTWKNCKACGAMNRNPYTFPLPRFCSKCGANLSPSPPDG